MTEMEDKLGTILNNPQLMQQIMSMAQSIGQNSSEHPAEHSKESSSPAPSLDPEMIRKIAGLTSGAATDSQQRALLNALVPYVAREKLNRLERAMRAAKMAQMATSLLGSGGLLTLTGR